MQFYKNKPFNFTALVLLLSLTLISGCQNRYYQGEKSDHFDGTKFFNPATPEGNPQSGFLKFIKWRLFSDKDSEWPEKQDNQILDKPPPRVFGSNLRISYVGHASLLIQTRGINILTDPIWSERASPFSFVGPKRISSPGIDFADLPKIDVVIISHNHYDHLDEQTIVDLWQKHQPKIIVPLGNDTIIKDFDPAIQVFAYDWHDAITISQDIKITLVPVQHWSGRGLFDRNEALWTGYVIESPDGNIYFSGDLGYGNGDYFDFVAKHFEKIRFAAIGIGAYKPRWFMKYSHLNPDDAVKAFLKLNAEYGLGIHHGVFSLGDDAPNDAANDLVKAKAKYQLTAERFKTMTVGQHWFVPPVTN